jgi:hypothetical protein
VDKTNLQFVWGMDWIDLPRFKSYSRSIELHIDIQPNTTAISIGPHFLALKTSQQFDGPITAVSQARAFSVDFIPLFGTWEQLGDRIYHNTLKFKYINIAIALNNTIERFYISNTYNNKVQFEYIDDSAPTWCNINEFIVNVTIIQREMTALATTFSTIHFNFTQQPIEFNIQRGETIFVSLCPNIVLATTTIQNTKASLNIITELEDP